MIKLFLSVILTVVGVGAAIGYAAKERVGALFGDGPAKAAVVEAKPVELTVEQLKQKAMAALEKSELKLVDLRAKSNLQRRELAAVREKAQQAEENLCEKSRRVQKLSALADFSAGCAIGDRHISRSDWAAQRDRELAEKKSMEADVKSRRSDVAKRTALLQELDYNLAACMGEIRSSRDAIDRAAGVCVGAEAREQLAALIALSSGEKFRGEVNDAVAELQRRAMEGDARADVILLPMKGTSSEFSNADLDIAMGEREAQTRR